MLPMASANIKTKAWPVITFANKRQVGTSNGKKSVEVKTHDVNRQRGHSHDRTTRVEVERSLVDNDLTLSAHSSDKHFHSPTPLRIKISKAKYKAALRCDGIYIHDCVPVERWPGGINVRVRDSQSTLTKMAKTVSQRSVESASQISRQVLVASTQNHASSNRANNNNQVDTTVPDWTTTNHVIAGDDVVIYQYKYHASMKPVVTCSNINQRMTLVQLQTQFPSPYHFVWNKNVKETPDELKGLLCYTRNAIWSIIEAYDDKAVAVKLLPEGDTMRLTILNLWELGYPVQQVNGELVGVMMNPRSMPIASSGERLVQMDPSGPDVIRLPEYDQVRAGKLIKKIKSKKRHFLLNDKSIPNEPLPEKVPVVYVLDKPDLRKSPGVDQEKKFCVPLWKKRPAKEDWYNFQQFVELTKTQTMKFLSQRKMSKGKFNDYLKKLANGEVKECVVPCMKGKRLVRIKCVSDREYRSLETMKSFAKLDHEASKNHYLFGYETRDLEGTPGVLVASWTDSPLISNPIISYDYVKAMIDVYGRGFGNRWRSHCFGLNAFRAPRCGNATRCSPTVAKDELAEHQYFNHYLWSHPLLQPVMEKCLRKLTKNAVKLMKQLNPSLGEFAEPWCTKSIATTGLLGTGPTKSVPAFCNQIHRDTCDELNEEEWASMRKFADPTMRRLLDFDGRCLPTTCGYQVVFKDSKLKRSMEVHQWFVLSGLGLAMLIENGRGINFLGSTFNHVTTVCITHYKNEELIRWDNSADVLIFAWGETGGSKTAKAAKATAMKTRSSGNTGTNAAKRRRTS